MERSSKSTRPHAGAEVAPNWTQSVSSSAPANPIPEFGYNLSSPSLPHYGCIFSGDDVYHQVSNFAEFYEALGYNPEMAKTPLLPDEFIWERYVRDGAVKSAKCLRVQIAVYLHKHSAKFNAKFGRAYDEMIGMCMTGDTDDGDDHCLNCPKHPRFLSY